jgi:hypothetical protein
MSNSDKKPPPSQSQKPAERPKLPADWTGTKGETKPPKNS